MLQQAILFADDTNLLTTGKFKTQNLYFDSTLSSTLLF